MVGKIFGSRYEVLERIGNGGMSLVYRARDITLNRLVAVKILKHQWAEDDEVVHRFDQEARAAASLVNRHIVQIYDVGREEPDIHYMVMELVAGETLRSKLDREGALPIAEALDIADQVAQGLEAAHAQKVVHRDIKPQNILIATDGTVKVTDFGIAYAATSGTLVNTGSLLGTVQYLSPEQARGKIVGPQSDLYSLGIVLFEMLTGKLPFEADSPIGVAIKHLQDTAPDVTLFRSDVPEPVAKIVRRALSKDPAERYQSAQAMRQDIQRALHPEEHLPEPVPSPVPQTPKPAKKKRRWVPWAVAGAIVVALLGGGILAFEHWIYSPVVTLPNVKGQSLGRAKAQLGRLGLTVSVTGKAPSSHLPKNYVLDEIPPAGTQIKAGQNVEVVVSTGPQQVTVPDLKGQDVFQAVQNLKTENLKAIIHHVKSNSPQGEVVRQSPAPNASLAEGQAVTLWVSKGPAEAVAVMPNLEGLSVEQAASLLIAMNVTVGTPTTTYSTEPVNTIIDQSPEPYSSLNNTTSVNVTVSQGPSPQSAHLPKNITLATWQIPNSAAPKSVLKVVVTDSAGNEEVFYQQVNPGQQIQIPVTWYGTSGQLLVFLNGQAQAPQPLVANGSTTSPAVGTTPPS
ncbi:MAG: serine/threonine-protein kinase [Sulfobacillus thermosulfidooxidans]|uniref:protein kinase domain-containing protein n=1 Tax=Sulfobacillus TaxID=28033 RepID=UPI000CD0F9AF|nr:PASTA domain-containing protein [Sulfobacillus sp. hq2]POB09228.1 serine/threonine protein kinase [Sulfobacillus sp. hq2]PSR37187.1 MAG: serine/threonine-protein kinase [Sulfobacillus thermosulfidooxidans]